MRIACVSIILLLSACSRAPDHDDAPAAEMADSSAPAAPGIAVTAAPGVAFAYNYAFSLPAARIAAAQEAHAQACEKLGPGRCRITAMRYRLVGENDVQAMLAFKLDPALARAFGKNGIAAIESAKGRLINAEITGSDAGATIKGLEAGKAGADANLARIDTQLGRKDLPAAERAELQRQRGDLASTIAQVATSARDERDSLASTPMVFDYRSGAAVRGFDPSAPLTSALDTAIASAQTTLAILLGFLAIFGPPVLLALVLWLLWRRFGSLLPVRRGARAESAVS